ncbi:hypothetical protein LTS18_011228 [Coniosporium uncinatum]|uniref:Uncharacterized protein n=1 Tax=Coniosporium uncinatum TaxID=93489 RepID=A0ACC3DWN9_9PEZI|nr:hypothetical protein LTS18_011228 [Coniosporium uncinatum]
MAAMTMPHHARQAIEAMLAYQFKNPDLLWEALQAAGSCVTNIGGRRLFNDGNKRLALVGDAAMRATLLDTWYQTEHDSDKDSAAMERTMLRLGLGYA